MDRQKQRRQRPGANDQHLAATILEWYEQNARVLPWRSSNDPYAILVSELMLQQTRTTVVLPFFRKFMQRFPDVCTLASSPLDDVLVYWSGLGYYRRAALLHAACRQICGDQKPQFPGDENQWLALPGVGRYTAAAVASRLGQSTAAVVDGNVKRFYARLHCDRSVGETLHRHTERWANRIMVNSRAGDFNQALMEFGALLCTAKTPRCFACPLRNTCGAYRAGKTDLLPMRSKGSPVTRVALQRFVVRNPNGDVGLVRNPVDAKFLAGMWDLPDCLPAGLTISDFQLHHQFRHQITRFRIDVKVYWSQQAFEPQGQTNPPALRFLAVAEILRQIALTSLLRKALAGVIGSP